MWTSTICPNGRKVDRGVEDLSNEMITFNIFRFANEMAPAPFAPTFFNLCVIDKGAFHSTKLFLKGKMGGGGAEGSRLRKN